MSLPSACRFLDPKCRRALYDGAIGTLEGALGPQAASQARI